LGSEILKPEAIEYKHNSVRRRLVWATRQNVLKLPTLMMGFGLPDDNLHAPNEKFHIANFHRGIESIVRLLEIVAGQ
jgi:acetylornithine deacetylase/succinyl-diaminopimelate desuccinylase-like protein